jgi:hypothetical protein
LDLVVGEVSLSAFPSRFVLNPLYFKCLLFACFNCLIDFSGFSCRLEGLCKNFENLAFYWPSQKCFRFLVCMDYAKELMVAFVIYHFATDKTLKRSFELD